MAGGVGGKVRVSAFIDERRPYDIDHAETIVGLAVEDVAGILVAWSRAIGKALYVDVPLRIERNLLIPVLGKKLFRLARRTSFPVFCRAEVDLGVFADEIGYSTRSEVFDEVLSRLDNLSAVVPPNERVDDGTPRQSPCARSCQSGDSEGAKCLHAMRLQDSLRPRLCGAKHVNSCVPI